MEWIIVLLLKYKYVIMLWLMIAEWPAVAFVCAFLAAQWVFSFWIVYVFSIVGDLIGDIGRYRVGRLARRFGATELLEKEKQGIKIDRTSLTWKTRRWLRVATKIYNLEKKSVFGYIYSKMDKHFFLSLFIVKITPPLSVPGHLSFGFFKVKFRRFFFQTLLLCFLLESIFLNLWYFSSISVNVFKSRLDTIGFILSLVVIGPLALWLGFVIIKKIRNFSKATKNIE